MYNLTISFVMDEYLFLVCFVDSGCNWCQKNEDDLILHISFCSWYFRGLMYFYCVDIIHIVRLSCYVHDKISNQTLFVTELSAFITFILPNKSHYILNGPRNLSLL